MSHYEKSNPINPSKLPVSHGRLTNGRFESLINTAKILPYMYNRKSLHKKSISYDECVIKL